jgi:hypothetical protein
MLPIERRLHDRGFEVLNLDYASRAAEVSTLAADVAQRVAAFGNGEQPVDFVTHSLGGTLLRTAVSAGLLPLERIGRAVMLGPPNGGSELADTLPHIPILGALYRRVTGPAGMQLGTGLDGIARQLPPVAFALGVIAGNRSYNPVFSGILGGPSDGKVRVDRAQVEGMSDFIVVPRWHPLLMAAPDVIDQTLHFLEHGKFRR